jgi:hypothetical protein
MILFGARMPLLQLHHKFGLECRLVLSSRAGHSAMRYVYQNDLLVCIHPHVHLSLFRQHAFAQVCLPHRKCTPLSALPPLSAAHACIRNHAKIKLFVISCTLQGHFQNYGPEFPVPAKRQKRLVQQYAEIEKQISRGR